MSGKSLSVILSAATLERFINSSVARWCDRTACAVIRTFERELTFLSGVTMVGTFHNSDNSVYTAVSLHLVW